MACQSAPSGQTEKTSIPASLTLLPLASGSKEQDKEKTKIPIEQKQNEQEPALHDNLPLTDDGHLAETKSASQTLTKLRKGRSPSHQMPPACQQRRPPQSLQRGAGMDFEKAVDTHVDSMSNGEDELLEIDKYRDSILQNILTCLQDLRAQQEDIRSALVQVTEATQCIQQDVESGFRDIVAATQQQLYEEQAHSTTAAALSSPTGTKLPDVLDETVTTNRGDWGHASTNKRPRLSHPER
ncbi:uncharacterized protein LOC134575682 [Pelobates fuscus]|uniref:uncharacterized protein LOC134575682 n=1 Tax=Pelobates fuscus TaxID=191477 RepID=UPI002FE4B8B4